MPHQLFRLLTTVLLAGLLLILALGSLTVPVRSRAGQPAAPQKPNPLLDAVRHDNGSALRLGWRMPAY